MGPPATLIGGYMVGSDQPPVTNQQQQQMSGDLLGAASFHMVGSHRSVFLMPYLMFRGMYLPSKRHHKNNRLMLYVLNNKQGRHTMQCLMPPILL